MSTINYTYNVIVDRFRQFADGHFQLRRFTHGEISQADLEKEAEWPWMHVKPRAINYSPGTRAFSFEIFISDLPRDKEDKTGYQAESITDCSLIFQDLINEIHLGHMFGDDVVLTRPVNSEPFVEQYTHTLTGVTGTIELSLDYDWSACSIPASWNYNTPTNSPADGWGALQFIESLDQNGVFVSLLNDEEAPGNSYYYGTDAAGIKGWYAIVDNIGLTCETLPDCATIISILEDIEALQIDVALKANTADLGATAFSNDYGDLDNLPTIPAAQVNSDWNATSGVAEILNKPTLTNGTVTAVTATAPMSSTGGATPNLSMSSANGTTNGYLLSSDWLIFNGKFNTPAGTTLQYVRGDGSLATFPTIPTSLPPSGAAGGDLTGTYPDPTVHRIHGIDMQSGTPTTNDTWVYGGSPAKWQHQHLNASQVDNDSSVTGATVKLALEQLDSSKVPTTRTISTTGPLSGGGDLSANRTISMPKATTLVDGYLSATDWATFNGKQAALGFTPVPTTRTLTINGTTQDLSADRTFTIATNAGTVTSVAALTLGTTGTDLSSTVATGTTTPVITLNVPTASAANRGALSSADWSTFNGKQAALVSGTNIKTVNSTTLLGSGDIAVQATLVSGTNIKTINSTSLLGSGDITVGTFTLPSLTSGSVLFSNGTTIAQDNTAFSWDNTNKRLSLLSTGDNLLNLTPQASGNAIVFNNSSYIKWGTVAYMRGFSTATLFSVLNSGYTNVFNIGTTAACYVNTGSNFLIGTTTDAGYKLDVNGTAIIRSTFDVNRSDGTKLLNINDAGAVFDWNPNNSSLHTFRVRGNTTTVLLHIKSNEERIGMGTLSPVASAMLDITSTTKGFLPPRMTTTQKNAIVSPASGLVVYDTTLNKLCVRGASAWETITSV
jgi:hypothetical protein